MTETDKARLIVLGKVGRPHALDGAFFVSGRDEPLPKAYAQVWIGVSPEVAMSARVIASRMQAGRPILKCTAATSREEAQSLVGQWIYAAREKAREAYGGVWLWDDLKGREVVDVSGLSLGVIEQVYNAGASDVATIRGAEGRALDIPLIDDYLALDDPSQAGPLRLKVPASHFSELWE